MIRISTASSVAAALLALPAPVSAQNFPVRSVRMIVPFPPGGGNDIVGRVLAQQLSDQLGQQVIVDNRGGAAGIVGAEIAARAAPDGYTLMLGGIASLAINPGLQRKLPYDPLRDFTAISLVGTGSNVLATHPSLPIRTVRQLIDYAKGRPGELSFASAGIGSSNHLAGELFRTMSGVQIVHVPYKGSGPAMAELLAGQVAISFAAISGVLPYLKDNRLRALAVTGAKRSAIAPDIPTVSESGLPGFEVVNWYSVVAPAATPLPLVQRLNAEVVKAIAAQEVRKRFFAVGVDAESSTPAEYAAYNRNELEKWAKVIRAAGARPE